MRPRGAAPLRAPQPALIRKLLPQLQSQSRAAPFLVGVSGGRDSVSLLHALRHWLGYQRLVVCHLDHGLRAESAADAVFVSTLAEHYQCAFEGERRDVASTARRQKLSMETAARAARYRFFASVAARRQCSAIFLAHHAQDRVETFLFNLLRGTGPAGLHSLAAVSTRKERGTELTLLRPLLSVWPEEISIYAAGHSLSWHEDSSNTDSRHSRNSIRHEIIPALEAALGREVCHPIWRAAEIIGAESEVINALTQSFPLGQDLDVEGLRTQPVALQRRILHTWLLDRKIPALDFAAIEAARALLSERRAKQNLPGGWHVRRRGGRLFVEPPVAGSPLVSQPGS